MKYEFWYNWDYAVKHNPKLMVLGTTGGFGGVRASMIEAVENGNRAQAEDMFWMLVQQTEWEWQCDLKFDRPLFEREQEEWFRRVLVTDRDDEQWDEVRHFMRTKPIKLSGNKVTVPLTSVMRDTRMDLKPDPMCVPTMATFKEWGLETSYARDLRQYIEFVLDDPMGIIDPMDSTTIY